MSRLCARLLLMSMLGGVLSGCPDDGDEPINDMLADTAIMDADPPDAGPADSEPADSDPPDGDPPDSGPPDGTPPDAGPVGPTSSREPLIDVCSGCGVARSADYILTQKIVPRTPRTARSADFTMELYAAPIRPEAAR